MLISNLRFKSQLDNLFNRYSKKNVLILVKNHKNCDFFPNSFSISSSNLNSATFIYSILIFSCILLFFGKEFLIKKIFFRIFPCFLGDNLKKRLILFILRFSFLHFAVQRHASRNLIELPPMHPQVSRKRARKPKTL